VGAGRQGLGREGRLTVDRLDGPGAAPEVPQLML